MKNMKQYNYEQMDIAEILSFMFYPRTDSSTATPVNAEDQHLLHNGASLHIRYYMTAENTDPVILFFHGNGEIVSDYDEMALRYNEFGLSFVAAEYRGYGLSTGSPSATHMMEDAHAELDAVVNKLIEKKHTGPLLVMGRSLGSAPAIELASCHQDKIKGLLLDSSFAYTIPVMQAVGVDVQATGIKEENCFHNIDKIKTITLPTYMIHGQLDSIIDLNNAAELQMESPALQKEFQTVPGADHNNIMDIAGKMYFEIMVRFIKNLGKVRKKKSGIR